MRVWWTTAYYELIKYSRMRSVLIILIGLPLLLILLLGSAFDTEIKPAKVAYFNEDQGELKASIDSFWNDEANRHYVKVLQAESESEVKDWVREGLADYGVYIPDYFSKQVLAGDASKWFTYSGRYEEKNIAADAFVDRYMSSVNMEIAATKTLDEAAAAGAGVQSGQSAAASESPIDIHNLGMGDSQFFGETSAIQYYSAAYLIMFLLYGGMTAAIALLTQKENGTLHRLYAIPHSFRVIVFGIIVGAVMLAALQAVVIVVFTTYFYGVDWGGQFGAISLICLLTTAAGAGLAITIASIARTRKTTQTLFTIVVFSMTFLSGGMMTGVEKLVGGANKLTINHWANISLRAIMSETNDSDVWHGIGILTLIALALTIIAVIRLPKVVKQHA
ncbi:ABC transporter permease [Paenibacillus sp. LHD-38]|uniref:ABC transporter permease n=1 Tax=Paenibacillus sp. LHD-38 TaxID=3072143 RepID=UPI00280E647F|nr:ABC transporter permease [Paenibacillus sp. LHD-38]MDQ8733506.1 ABC transporter permease [Paenibacillus sp. LHD-38]